jgi:hypothetical protein
MDSTVGKATKKTDSITSSPLLTKCDTPGESVERLTMDSLMSDRKAGVRSEDEHEQQNKSKFTGVQDEKYGCNKTDDRAAISLIPAKIVVTEECYAERSGERSLNNCQDDCITSPSYLTTLSDSFPSCETEHSDQKTTQSSVESNWKIKTNISEINTSEIGGRNQNCVDKRNFADITSNNSIDTLNTENKSEFITENSGSTRIIDSCDDNSNNKNDDDKNENENENENEINIEKSKITDKTIDCNDLLNFDPSLFSNTTKTTSNSNNKDKYENITNPKFNHKKKTKDEKHAENCLKSKQKRSEYTNRLKIRNCEAWNLLTEDEQNLQKNDRKEKIELSEKVSFFSPLNCRF